MSKTTSLLSALLCTFIWGTTFIAQDTGMDNIGPFTFNAVRFFIGFLAITPLVFLFELKKYKSEFKSDIKTFINLTFLIGLSLFLGSALVLAKKERWFCVHPTADWMTAAAKAPGSGSEILESEKAQV